MNIISLVLLLIWLLSFIMCGMGFVENEICPTLIPIICALFPIINFIMAIYLWYKIKKKSHYKFGDLTRKFISDLKEL